MFSVIFEVYPQKTRFDEYLDLAKQLKPILQQIDGFVDNERFQSKLKPGWILSHSTWRDEKSVVRWRTTEEHHFIQEQGRNGILDDYHLRVGDVTADTNPPAEAPIHELRFDKTETGKSPMMTLTEIVPLPGKDFGEPEAVLNEIGLTLQKDKLNEYDVLGSIYTPGKLAILLSWKAETAANN